MEPYAAVVLAGGRASRLGGVAKPDLVVAGRTLLQGVLDAVADAAPRIVVGPGPSAVGTGGSASEAGHGVLTGVVVTREEPPGGGPVAGLAAGLVRVPAGVTWAAVLAADLPFLTAGAVTGLRRAATGREGAVLVDEEGREQYLVGVWRVAALTGALADLGDPAGASIRRLVAGLDVARVPATGHPPPWFDCDDPADVRRAREWTREERR